MSSFLERIRVATIRPERPFATLSMDTWAALGFDTPSRALAAVLLAVAVVAGVIYVSRHKAMKSAKPLPPGPRPWPIIGSLAILGPLVHQDFARLSKKYGPVMMVRLGSIKTVVLSSPKSARELLTKYDKVVAARPDFSQFQIIACEKQSLTASSYGSYWRMLRKVFTLELMTNRRLHQFQKVRKSAILYMLESLHEDCKDGQALQIRPRLSNATSDNITSMVINKQFFGANVSTSDLRQRSIYVDAFAEIVKIAGAFVIGDYIPLLKNLDILGYKKKMRAIRTANNKLFGAIVEEHRQNRDPSAEAKDFVDVLLDPAITTEKNAPLNDTQIQGVLQDVIVAGTETSSTSTEWVLAELLRNPRTLRRVQEELDEVIGRDRLVEESDLSRLPYLQAVVKEGLRLHPTLPTLLPRWSTEPCEVEGYHIPKSSLIFINAWAIGRDPNFWNRASEFYPERFMDCSTDTAGQHYELLPFGAGRRVCPGRSLALVIVQYLLAALLQAFELQLPPGWTPETLNMEEAPGGITLRAVPLQVVASPRLAPSVFSDILQS